MNKSITEISASIEKSDLSIWETVFQNKDWGKYPSEDLIRFVAKNFYQVADRRKIKILEIGCGPGANLWYLAREGFRFVGVDGSETAIAKASKRLDEECSGWHKHSDLYVGDVGSLPEADDSLDAVIDNECVYCNDFEKSKSIYGEAHRVLKKRGVLFVRTFSAGSWGDGTGLAAGHNSWYCAEGPLKDKGLARFTELDEIPELLHGFDILGIELISRSASDRKNIIKEWVITARKN